MKRIVPIITILVLLVSMLTVSTSASEIQTEIEYPFPNCSSLLNDKEYLIWQGGSGWRLATWPKGEQRYIHTFTDGVTLLCKESTITTTSSAAWGASHSQRDSAMIYVVTGDKWVQGDSAWYALPSDSNTKEYYSSTDIQKNDAGTVANFFHNAPYQTSILSGALREVRSLIPYLMALLIGLVAFWKAWRFLSMQLRTA